MAGQDAWPLIRAGWAAGKTADELSQQFGKAAKTIHNRASVEKWARDREEIGNILNGSLQAAVAVQVVNQAIDYVTQHLNDWQTIRGAIMGVIETEPDPLDKAKMASAVYKALEAVQKGQRLSLGLDRKDEEKQQEQQGGIVRFPMKQAHDDGNG